MFHKVDLLEFCFGGLLFRSVFFQITLIEIVIYFLTGLLLIIYSVPIGDWRSTTLLKAKENFAHKHNLDDLLATWITSAYFTGRWSKWIIRIFGMILICCVGVRLFFYVSHIS
jgi:hypothetical protein